MKLKSFIERVGPNGTTISTCFTCAHCNTIVEQEKNKDMGFCHKCFYPLCLKCGANNRCIPFEKKIEMYEKKMKFQKDLGC
jgi:DNA-directed RNA polymerase subunit RPC12/RpoP